MDGKETGHPKDMGFMEPNEGLKGRQQSSCFAVNKKAICQQNPVKRQQSAKNTSLLTVDSVVDKNVDTKTQ